MRRQGTERTQPPTRSAAMEGLVRVGGVRIQRIGQDVIREVERDRGNIQLLAVRETDERCSLYREDHELRLPSREASAVADDGLAAMGPDGDPPRVVDRASVG